MEDQWPRKQQKKMIDMGIEEIKKKNSNIKSKIKNLNFSHTSHFFGACLRGTSVKKQLCSYGPVI